MQHTLALAMIVKGDDQEAELLKRCLASVADHVDKIYIANTHKKGKKPNKKVEEVASFFGAEVYPFEWINDFSAARNFIYSKVDEKYDYTMFLDADDVVENAYLLPKGILRDEKYKDVDVFSMWYVYDHDKWGNPVVVHHRPFITRNDGSFIWRDSLHEYLDATREVRRFHIEEVVVHQYQKENKNEERAERNYEIAKEGHDKNPYDPRSKWNLARALSAVGKHKESVQAYEEFLDLTESPQEKYLAFIWCANEYHLAGENDKAEMKLHLAIGMQPNYPDAYIQMGKLLYSTNKFSKAIEYLKTSLTLKPPYYEIIVYNPRDYDYTPIRMLAMCYLALNNYLLAYEMFELLLNITPKDEELKQILSGMKEKKEIMEKALELVEKAKNCEDDEEAKKMLDEVPFEVKYHPVVCRFRNNLIIKKETSGKDIAFFCGYTKHEWNPDIADTKGIGGSEEAVIHLSKRFAKNGWNVSVYCNCGHTEQEYEGVKYYPFQAFNPRDAVDVLVIWRHPQLADYDLGAKVVLLDVHDVIGKGEFTKKRLTKIDKVMFKSEFHRKLYPTVPDDKAVIVGNGIDADLFLKDDVERNEKLIINTSSPDRSLDTLLDLFQEVQKQVPDAHLSWAYGWDIYENAHSDNAKMMEWADMVKKKGENIKNFHNLGKISHSEVAKLYKKAKVFAYPTEFAEIHCISAAKAQAAGAIPVTTDFAALNETVQIGHKIHSDKTAEDWAIGKFHFGIQDPKKRKEWVDACVKALNEPTPSKKEREEYARKNDWGAVFAKWENAIMALCQAK